MQIETKIAEDIRHCFKKAKKILLISHRNPDPDCLGSNLALRQILTEDGKKVISACIDEIPANYMFFTELKEFVKEIDPEKFDLYISLDCGSIDQTGFANLHEKNKKHKKPWINIDHHPSNNRFGTVNLVIEDAASTTLILYHLLKKWGVGLDSYLATCLLFGLYYDTGSFMHSSTNGDVLESAAELLARGANQKLIVRKLFKNHTVEQLKIWGKALNNARITDNDVVVTGILEKDFRECKANSSDLSGLIDYLSSVKGTNFATILSHDENGNVRGSLRTRRDDINLSEIAKNFGGGGHKKASGFTLKGKLDKKTYWSITSD